MTFQVTIDDASKLAGITAAREAYNASLPETEGQEQPDGYLATDAEYVQFVMDNAAESYAKQYGV